MAPEVTYVGVHDAVEVDATGSGSYVVVNRDESVDVAESVAHELVEQTDNWEPKGWTPPSDEPFEGYDDLNAKEVVARLADLSDEEVAAIKAYEADHQARKTITNFEHATAPPPSGTGEPQDTTETGAVVPPGAGPATGSDDTEVKE